jgi:hypothetical protein
MNYRAQQAVNGNMFGGGAEGDEGMDARAAARATKEAFVTVTVTLSEAMAMFRQFVKEEEHINDREVTSVDMFAKGVKMADVWLNGLGSNSSTEGSSATQSANGEGHETRRGTQERSGAAAGAGASHAGSGAEVEQGKVTWRSIRLLHTITQSVAPMLNDLLNGGQTPDAEQTSQQQQGSSSRSRSTR